MIQMWGSLLLFGINVLSNQVQSQTIIKSGPTMVNKTIYLNLLNTQVSTIEENLSEFNTLLKDIFGFDNLNDAGDSYVAVDNQRYQYDCVVCQNNEDEFTRVSVRTRIYTAYEHYYGLSVLLNNEKYMFNWIHDTNTIFKKSDTFSSTRIGNKWNHLDYVSESELDGGTIKLTNDWSWESDIKFGYGVPQVKETGSSSWKSICDEGWTAEATHVACRSAGFAFGWRLFPHATNPYSHIPGDDLGYEGISCTGNEASLSECTYSSSLSNCNYYDRERAVILYCVQRWPILRSSSDVPIFGVPARKNRTDYMLPLIYSEDSNNSPQLNTLCSDDSGLDDDAMDDDSIASTFCQTMLAINSSELEDTFSYSTSNRDNWSVMPDYDSVRGNIENNTFVYSSQSVCSNQDYMLAISCNVSSSDYLNSKCNAEGEFCDTHARCCDGYCSLDERTCAKAESIPRPEGFKPCSSNDQCETGLCDDPGDWGVCKVDTLGVCLTQGDMCTFDHQCCGNLLCRGTDGQCDNYYSDQTWQVIEPQYQSYRWHSSEINFRIEGDIDYQSLWKLVPSDQDCCESCGTFDLDPFYNAIPGTYGMRARYSSAYTTDENGNQNYLEGEWRAMQVNYLVSEDVTAKLCISDRGYRPFQDTGVTVTLKPDQEGGQNGGGYNPYNENYLEDIESIYGDVEIEWIQPNGVWDSDTREMVIKESEFGGSIEYIITLPTIDRYLKRELGEPWSHNYLRFSYPYSTYDLNNIIYPARCNFHHPYRTIEEDCFSFETDLEFANWGELLDNNGHENEPGVRYSLDDWQLDDEQYEGRNNAEFRARFKWWNSSAPEIMNRTVYLYHILEEGWIDNLNVRNYPLVSFTLIFVDDAMELVSSSLRLDGQSAAASVTGDALGDELLVFSCRECGDEPEGIDIRYGPESSSYNSYAVDRTNQWIDNKFDSIGEISEQYINFYTVEVDADEVTAEDSTNLKFSVTVVSRLNPNLTTSAVSDFKFNYPTDVDTTLPTIYRATGEGCQELGRRTVNCPTNGLNSDGNAAKLTLQIRNFPNETRLTDRELDLYITIDGRECENPSFTGFSDDQNGIVESYAEVDCEYGSGVSGFGTVNYASVQLNYVLTDPNDDNFWESKTTPIATYFNYSWPNITEVSGCMPHVNASEIKHTVNCTRNGGSATNRITVKGSNFGSTGARVFVGGTQCTTTDHDSDEKHTILYCVYPPGTELNNVVWVMNSRGGTTQATQYGALSYIQCPKGKRQDGTDCVDCPAGFYSDELNAKACSACDAGEYAGETGSQECSKCQPGTYTDHPGASECDICMPGFYSATEASISCFECPAGQFSPLEGQRSCQLCSTFSSPDEDRTYCLCHEGYYAYESEAIQVNVVNVSLSRPLCKACSTGMNCTEEGLAWYDVQPLKGYGKMINTEPKSLEMIECINEACIGGSDYCTTGYTGIICTECESGLGATSGFGCETCLSPQMNLLRMLGVMVVIVLGLLFFIVNTIKSVHAAKSDFSAIGKIGFSFLQFNSLALQFDYDFPPFVKDFLTVQEQPATIANGVLSVDCLVNGEDEGAYEEESEEDRNRPPIPAHNGGEWGNYDWNNYFSETEGTNANFYYQNNVFGYYNEEERRWYNASDLTPVSQTAAYKEENYYPELSSSDGPNPTYVKSVLFLLMPVLVFLVCRCCAFRKYRKTRATPFDKALPCKISSRNVSKLILIDAPEDSKLTAFLKSTNHFYTSIIIVFFMLHANLTMAAFSLFNCKQLGKEPGDLFMIQDMSVRCWSGDHTAMALFVGLPMLICYVIGMPLWVGMKLYRSRHELMKGVDLMNTHVLERYHFLFKGYEPEYYYWEIVVMARKVGMVAIAVFVSHNIQIQTLLATLLVVIALTFHSLAQPYDSDELDGLELMSLFGSFCTFFFGQFLFVDDLSIVGRIAVSLIIVLTNFAFMAIVVLMILGLVSRKVGAFAQKFRRALCCAGRREERARRRADSLRRHSGSQDEYMSHLKATQEILNAKIDHSDAAAKQAEVIPNAVLSSHVPESAVTIEGYGPSASTAEGVSYPNASNAPQSPPVQITEAVVSPVKAADDSSFMYGNVDASQFAYGAEAAAEGTSMNDDQIGSYYG